MSPIFFSFFVCIFLGGKTTKNIRKEMETVFFPFKNKTPGIFLKKDKNKIKEALNLALKAVLQLSCNRKEGKI